MTIKNITICLLCACAFVPRAYGKCASCAVNELGFCATPCKICGNGGCYVCCDTSNGGDGPTTPTCPAGEFGNEQTLECIPCPAAPDGCAATSPAGTTSITGRYIKSGCNASDATGAYTYTANCAYSN